VKNLWKNWVKNKGCSILDFFLKYRICQLLIAPKKEKEKKPMGLGKECEPKKEEKF